MSETEPRGLGINSLPERVIYGVPPNIPNPFPWKIAGELPMLTTIGMIQRVQNHMKQRRRIHDQAN